MGRQSEADERFRNQVRALGYAVLRMQKYNEVAGDDGVRVTDIRFKLDADNRTSVLVIVKGTAEGAGVVGFVGAESMESAVIALSKRLVGGSVKWREDRPWPRPDARHA